MGPKKKTARDRDPRTLERDEQCQLQAVTCECDAKLDTKSRAAFESQSSDRIAESDVAEDTYAP